MSGSPGVRRTTRRVFSILACVGLLAGLLAVSAGTAAAAPGGPKNLTCSGGSIPSGTYGTITVSGSCEVESGATVVVRSGLTVAPGGFLVASGALDNGGQAPDCDRTITVSGGIQVGTHGSLFLGDGPGSGCQTNTKTTVNGGLAAADPRFLLIHGVTINGGIDSHGGPGVPVGGPICFPDPPPDGPVICPFWAALEDNHIVGGVTIDGYDGFWFGFIRNHVNGSVTLGDNVLEDPDGNEYVSNSIHGRLACAGNDPAPWVGDSQGDPNQVTGPKTGQCVGL
jgi:hypothetical protein